MRTKTKRDRLQVAQPELLQKICALVSYNIPIAVIESWDQDTRDEVQEWAAREHFSASDCIVRRRPLPKVVENYRMKSYPCCID